MTLNRSQNWGFVYPGNLCIGISNTHPDILLNCLSRPWPSTMTHPIQSPSWIIMTSIGFQSCVVRATLWTCILRNCDNFVPGPTGHCNLQSNWGSHHIQVTKRHRICIFSTDFHFSCYLDLRKIIYVFKFFIWAVNCRLFATNFFHFTTDISSGLANLVSRSIFL